MTTAQKFNTTYENKFKSLRPFLRHTARGDEDLIQEGAISILKSLKRIPEAPNNYLRIGVRWSILNQVNGVGKSVDIPKRYNRQFPITIVHYDAIPDNSDAELSQAILTDRNRLPLDGARNGVKSTLDPCSKLIRVKSRLDPSDLRLTLAQN